MSDTPESDKNSVEWDRANEAGCSYKFACHLERDRDELRERAGELVATLDEVLNDWQYGLTDSQADSYQIARDLIAKTKEAK
jgi:hypothetical protein